MKQIEKGLPAPIPQPQRPAVVLEPEMKPPTGLVVTVRRFRFVGNIHVDEARLQAAVAAWLNRPIDFVELQKAAAAAAALYRDAGWVVRAYLPQQEIDGGEVTIRIVEAVFGSVKIEAAQGIRVSQESVRARVLKAQKPGEVLHTEAIDRSLLILEDTPGVRVRGHLTEGQNDGETDLVLQLDPQPLLAGDAGVDNTGSHSTGANRLTANLYANSPLRWGDLATGNAIHTQGSDYLRAAWSAPLGSDGLRAGVSQSYLEYRVVTSEFSTLGLKGHSATTGLDLSYPLIRSTSRNLYLSLNQNFKSFYNLASGASTSDYSVNVASAGLSGNRFDNLAGGGVLAGSVVLSAGRVDLSGSANQHADAITVQTQGGFQKLQYSLSRRQVINPDLSLNAMLSGQMASKNLDSGDKFFLGGAAGVRAYPSNEAGGSDGNLINIELSYNLPGNYALTGFYDWGKVTVNHHNDFAGAANPNQQSLQGAGLSLAVPSAAGVTCRLTWAHRIGSNPNPTNSGNDQDGTRVLNRFWVQASMSF